MRIEVVCPTKDRYEHLAMLLWSLAEQTYKLFDVTIIDDSENRKDIRSLDFVLPILRRLDDEEHHWRVLFGSKRGPHWCHQLGMEQSRNDYIYRVDDDCVLDVKVLETLVSAWRRLEAEGKRVGAVAPVVLDPAVSGKLRVLPVGFRSYKKFQGKVGRCGETYGEHQWFEHPDGELQEVEHLYSTFLYSKEAGVGIGGDELRYNKVGHREETDFTYRLHKAGWSCWVVPESKVWHLRGSRGGIRTYKDPSLWDECHYFYVKKFGFEEGKIKDRVIKLVTGMGDTLCATPVFRAMKRSGEKVIVSAVYGFLLEGNKFVDELIFPDEEKMYEVLDYRDMYRWAWDNDFDGSLEEAWCKVYDVNYDGLGIDYTVFDSERKWVEDRFGKEEYVLISVRGATPVIVYGLGKLGAGGQVTGLKDWFKDRWEELVKNIKKLGLKVYQVGGMKDEKIEGCDGWFLDINPRLSVAMLERSKGFVSVDTFLQHAGSAIRKKGVVLFGPTDPKRFGHKDNVNVYKEDACKKDRECWIGDGKKSCWWAKHTFKCDSRECMSSIEVGEVFSSLREVVGR